MPLLPEYDDSIYDGDFSDIFSNLNDLNKLRASGVDAPKQPVDPKIENPNEMESFKEEVMANKIIAAERKDNWREHKANKAMEQNPLTIGIFAYIGYLIFFK